MENNPKWSSTRKRGDFDTSYTPAQQSQSESKNDSHYVNHVAGLVERRATQKFVKEHGSQKENTIGDIVKDFSRHNEKEV